MVEQYCDCTSVGDCSRPSRAHMSPQRQSPPPGPPAAAAPPGLLRSGLSHAVDCLYLALYFVTQFFVDVTDAVSISSVLGFQFLIAAALVASATVISPPAAAAGIFC